MLFRVHTRSKGKSKKKTKKNLAPFRQFYGTRREEATRVNRLPRFSCCGLFLNLFLEVFNVVFFCLFISGFGRRGGAVVKLVASSSV